jgi:hypothetical protein
MELETDVAVNLRSRYGKFAVHVLKCLKPENVSNRDLLNAVMGVGGHELLDAVRTVLKGSERYLEI